MRKVLALTSALVLATGVHAQEAQSEAEGQAQAQPAETQSNVTTGNRASTPQEVTRNVHGSWQIRCVTVEPQQCYLYQLIVNDQNAPLMEFSLIPAKDETGGEVTMVGTIITPLNVVLERGVVMQVDENDPRQESYGWCAPIGCFSRFGIDEARINEFKSGTKITTAIFMMRNPGQGIEIELPLDGFGDAYDELMEIEAEQQAQG